MTATPLADRAAVVLEPWLGPHTAKVAIGVACQRLGCTAAELRDEDAERLATALLPMLRTLAGRSVAESLARAIKEGA